ncbi:MAG TPA: glycosyltransferase, partial [Anaerolineales bacterium]|nr:glycosyltransferase [Anaerolineales bacterium]
VVQMFHTLGIMKNRIAQRPDEREPDIRVRIETELMHAADRLILATPAEQAQLQWLYRVETVSASIIPPGVDLNVFYPRPGAESKRAIHAPADTFLLLFVGRIEALKGIDTLLRAVGVLRARGTCDCGQLALAIIGGDPDLPPERQTDEMRRVMALRDELGLSELVTFLGKQDQDALPEYYTAADCVIMPSHYESFGMVALEAMACGTPVIASEVGGLAFLVQDGQTGFTVPDQDPEALADRICMLISDRDLKARMSAQARAHARNYGWPAIADRIMDVYQGLGRSG